MTVLVETALSEASLFHRGKVRDTYDLGERLLMVATDRISAFDVVLPNGIPDKGRILTQLSAFWFERTGGIVPNHFIRLIDSTEAEDVPFASPCPAACGRATSCPSPSSPPPPRPSPATTSTSPSRRWWT
jgi:phosphoribosylaminoimidazole-succinocarboxamide synthase